NPAVTNFLKKGLPRENSCQNMRAASRNEATSTGDDTAGKFGMLSFVHYSLESLEKCQSRMKIPHFAGRKFSAPEPYNLARNCCLLGRDRYWGDSVSELFGFGLEALDL